MASELVEVSGRPTQFSATSNDGKYIPVLDGWRAVAILFVIVFHGLLNTDLSGSHFLRGILGISEKMGTLGVLIFFCISGYLITQRLIAETRRNAPGVLRNFYIKRLFRILPPLIVYLTAICILSAIGLIRLKPGDWAAFFFVSNYFHGGSWYTSQFWSLSVEEHFYLLWPICALVVGWRRSLVVGVCVILAVGIFRPWALSHFTLDPIKMAGLLQHTEMRIDYIMMGSVVAIAIAYYGKAKDVLERLGSPLALIALLIALVITTMHLPFEVRSIQAVLLTLMVCGSANSRSSIVSYLMGNRCMLFIGGISYSLYIWQQLVLGSYAAFKIPFLNSPAALLIKLCFAFLIASASYFLIERPFIARGRELLQSSRRLA